MTGISNPPFTAETAHSLSFYTLTHSDTRTHAHAHARIHIQHTHTYICHPAFTHNLTPLTSQAKTLSGGLPAGSVWQNNALLSPALLTIWSFVCAGVIVLNFTIMVMASLIQLSIVHATGNEGISDVVPEEHQYALDGRVRVPSVCHVIDACICRIYMHEYVFFC